MKNEGSVKKEGKKEKSEAKHSKKNYSKADDDMSE